MGNIWYLIFSMVIFFGGTLFFQLTCTSLNSLSVSAYNLPKKYWIISKNWNWTFLIFTWGYAFPMIVYCHTNLMMFSGLFIMFVGLASRFRDNDETAYIHQICAAIGIILSQISIIVDYHNYWICIIMVPSTIYLYLISNKYSQWMKILEIIACCLIYLTLILERF